jgi:hypothetical protein
LDGLVSLGFDVPSEECIRLDDRCGIHKVLRFCSLNEGSKQKSWLICIPCALRE